MYCKKRKEIEFSELWFCEKVSFLSLFLLFDLGTHKVLEKDGGIRWKSFASLQCMDSKQCDLMA